MMAEGFDPYLKWLGIAPKDQPPNHYRLLGIDPFTDDPDVIENAADQRMMMLRTFQTGEHATDSQKLLNEIAAARVCLLDLKKKAEYDRKLRAEQAANQPTPQVAPAPPPAPVTRVARGTAASPAEPSRTELPQVSGSSGISTAARRRSPYPHVWVWIGSGVIGVAVLVLALWLLSPGGTLPSSDELAGTKAGEEWSAKNGLGMEFCWCPPGKFKMGSPKNEGGHEQDEVQVAVTLTRGFWLAKHEVTQEQYQRIMASNPSCFAKGGSDADKVAGEDTSRFPVENVSWEEAMQFCRKLTRQERDAGRLPPEWTFTLPTEAQWEYGCRAGTTARFSWGSNAGGVVQHAWYRDNSKGRPYPVGQKAANPWGLSGLHGNVREWCRDWYHRQRPGGTDPEVTQAADRRVNRGGSWNLRVRLCRSAYRSGGITPDVPPRNHDVGFRVAVVQVAP